MKNKSKQQEHQQITNFIKSLSEKNYAEAERNLQKTVESKLINRISKYKNINIFKQ